MTFLNRRQLAEVLGCSEVSIQRWHEAGMPGKTHGKGRPAEFDAEECRRWLLVNGRHMKGVDASSDPEDCHPAPGNARWLDAKIRTETARAELAELELGRLRGELCAVADVRRGISSAARMLRDMILAVPNRIAPQVAGADAATAQRLMRDELRRALEQFAAMSAQELTSIAPRGAATGDRAAE